MSKIYKLRGYETRLANRSRRSNMDVKVFSLKLDTSRISKTKLAILEKFFCEAKWLYNSLLANDLKFDTKAKNVEVKVFNSATQKCDISENRPMTLTAQMKQGILRQTIQNGVLGRIKSRLKRLETAKMLNRFLPTTKFSPISFRNVETPLSSRLFRDGDFVMDRDIKAANTILCLGRFDPKITRKELMGLPVERLASVFADFGEVKLGALNQEAATL